MSKFIVKEDDHYLEFDRFVRDMEIITVCEPVASIEIATQFSSEFLAQRALKEVENNGKDIGQCLVKDVDVERADIEQQRKEAEKARAKAAWENTSEEGRKKLLGHILEDGGEKAVKEWLEAVGDTTTDATTVSKHDRIADIEARLGITLTDEQKEQLANK